ncbi:hypothetical protein [Alloactinosynnema sp. L-07]|nr:hypothetical protein [Alloactinosynnema sp. L-07]
MSAGAVRALVGSIADSAPIARAATVADEIRANVSSLDNLLQTSTSQDARTAVAELALAADLVREAGVALDTAAQLCRAWATGS